MAGFAFVLALFLFFCILCFHPLFSHAANSTIQRGQRISDGETLVSDGFNFEMGFFSLTNTSTRYVGIWYHNVTIPAYIWVANREKPVRGRGGAITINADGNLVVLDGENNEVWSSNVSPTSFNYSEAVLKDDGNLVLSTRNGSSVLWESFEDPTDTFVPGMKVPVGGGKSSSHPGFTSWKSENDPSKGNYTMVAESGESPPQIVILEGDRKRWRSGYWDNRIFMGVYNMTGSILYGFRLNDDNKGGRYFVYTPVNRGDKVRFQIGYDGYERKLMWNEDGKNWSVTQSEPINLCELYNYCGSFAVCHWDNSAECSCLEGFEPRDRDQWRSGNWSGGCERRTPLKAERAGNVSGGTKVSVGEDGFFEQNGVKLPDFAHIVNAGDSSSECESTCLRNSSCTAYAHVIGIGCMIWLGELNDIQRFENLAVVLHIRLADADLGNGEKKTKIWIIVVVVGLICLGIFAWPAWRYIRKLKAKKNNDLILTEVTNNTDLSLELSESSDRTLEGNQLSGPELPFFKFSSIAIATDNFSEENKLGQGGFGPVYKGKLAGGEEIAVKRLSARSCQGLVEFKNEIMLIAKLQHRNLVRLMGYSIQGEEKLLLYEYLPNKSLDCFLFDSVKKAQLDWKRRFEIIEGIARGLLYLHRDSRLRIIHRDLKASNILLGENMNPKISDFGLARIFGGNENETNTTKVVGTYGYIAPEYAMEGLFSVKSDVYSFGILLLEIICGRRNSSFRHSNDTSLAGYAWHLWSENRIMELVDPSIRDSSPENEVLRCIHIGMLCIQDSATHRPNMSSVVLMLESEATTLPLPRLPLFSSMRRPTDEEFYIESLDVSNSLTETMLAGR